MKTLSILIALVLIMVGVGYAQTKPGDIEYYECIGRYLRNHGESKKLYDPDFENAKKKCLKFYEQPPPETCWEYMLISTGSYVAVNNYWGLENTINITSDLGWELMPMMIGEKLVFKRPKLCEDK